MQLRLFNKTRYHFSLENIFAKLAPGKNKIFNKKKFDMHFYYKDNHRQESSTIKKDAFEIGRYKLNVKTRKTHRH